MPSTIKIVNVRSDIPEYFGFRFGFVHTATRLVKAIRAAHPSMNIVNPRGKELPEAKATRSITFRMIKDNPKSAAES